MAKKYHINVSEKNIENSKYCLICGDPGRVPKISAQLNDSNEISFNREYRVYLGYISNYPIVISSMGIGGPSTAIGVEEFGQLGINTFIRVGTSGILSEKVKLGDIISATGAIRDEGTTSQYIAGVFPAVANVDVILALRQAAHNLGLSSRYHEGIVHSKDSFYSETPKLIPDTSIENRWKSWKRAGALVTEMECSTLFVICQVRNWRAGGVLAAIGDTEKGELIIDPEKGQEEAIAIAIEGTRLLLKT